MTKHVPNHLFIDLETSAPGNIAQVCATIIQIIADAILNADILFSLYNYERRQDTHPFSIYYKYEQREATPKFHSALYITFSSRLLMYMVWLTIIMAYQTFQYLILFWFDTNEKSTNTNGNYRTFKKCMQYKKIK